MYIYIYTFISIYIQIYNPNQPQKHRTTFFFPKLLIILGPQLQLLGQVLLWSWRIKIMMVRISRSETRGVLEAWKVRHGDFHKRKKTTEIFNRCSAVCGIGGLGICRWCCNSCLLVLFLKTFGVLYKMAFPNGSLLPSRLGSLHDHCFGSSCRDVSTLFQTLKWWHVNLLKFLKGSFHQLMGPGGLGFESGYPFVAIPFIRGHDLNISNPEKAFANSTKTWFGKKNAIRDIIFEQYFEGHHKVVWFVFLFFLKLRSPGCYDPSYFF